MEATRVTAEEIKERMNRGEQFTFVDTRNPQAWGEGDTKLPGAIRVPAGEVEQYLDESRATGRSSPTALDRTRRRAPVWRRS